MRNSNQITDNDFGAATKMLGKHEFSIVKKLGHGISGQTFLVKNKDEDNFVVKEIINRDNEHLNEVKNEINILKKLCSDWIVGYEDSFEESGHFYIVMEYCAGGDISEKMKTQERNSKIFEEQQILDWLVQICLALQVLHGNNILHRDIKPQNVFLTEDGLINLGDFGCAKVMSSADAYAQSVVGAELYFSPEVYEQKYNSKSDIFSLGWLLHDLCMLDVWSNIMERHCLHAISLKGTPPEISESYSVDLQKLIRQMLSYNPKDRPSAEQVLASPFLNDTVKKTKGISEVLEKSIDDFNKAYNENITVFEELVKKWGESTDSLENIHYRTRAGSLGGAVVGAAGGITALVGAILAPFTFGVSLIVAGVGIGVGVIGGVTGAASNITNTVKQKELRENLEKLKQEYEKVSPPILNSLKKLRRLMRKIIKLHNFHQRSSLDNAQTAWRIGRAGVVGVTEFITLGMLASFGRIAVQTANIGRVVAAASGVLSGILVIADVVFIVKDSSEIHQMRQNWRTDDPDKVSSSALKSIAQMRKTYNELCKALKDIKNTREDLNAYRNGARRMQ